MIYIYMDNENESQSTIGKRSKRKGKHYEARVAQLLTEFTNVKFRRVPVGSGGYNKTGGLVIAKHIFTGDVFSANPSFIFSVEAKNRKDISLTALLKSPESSSITKYWYQCIEDATNNNKYPILFFKPNISDDWVCLRTSDIQEFNLNKSIRIDLKLYYTSVSLKIIDRDMRGKKIKAEIKNIILPDFTIMDWHEFTKHVNPIKLFTEEITEEQKADTEKRLATDDTGGQSS